MVLVVRKVKSSGRLSKVIVISEVVLSCALLLLSTGMVYSVNQQNTIDYGTTVEDIFTASVGLPEVEYESDEKRQQYYQSLAESLLDRTGNFCSKLHSCFTR